MKNIYVFIFLLVSLWACKKEVQPTAPQTPPTQEPTLQVWSIGDTSDVSTSTEPLIVLMGGSVEVDAAMQLMIQKSGGGDFVVLRATGSSGYNSYLYNDLGGVNSVETFLVNSRALASHPRLIDKVRKAEALFIAGGNQYDYVEYWKNTPLEEAINYLIDVKKIPIGGTSAGCAIQGRLYFSAANGTIRSEEALANPLSDKITIGKDDFLQHSILTNTITDTHYDNPDRRGRHVAFLARIYHNFGILAKGIGIEERTAVVIDGEGKASVLGENQAYFLRAKAAPESVLGNTPLVWINNQEAVEVYRANPNNQNPTSPLFNLNTWESIGETNGTWRYFYVENGLLKQN